MEHTLKKFISKWRIIALQYCVDFYQISMWISHRFTHVPSLLPSPSLSHPSRLSLNPCLSSLSPTTISHWLSILHVVMYVSMLVSPYIPPSLSSPASCVHKPVLCVCVSTGVWSIFFMWQGSEGGLGKLVPWAVRGSGIFILWEMIPIQWLWYSLPHWQQDPLVTGAQNKQWRVRRGGSIKERFIEEIIF